MASKKAWSVLHSLINDGILTENESWVLAKAIFDKQKEYIPTPFPVPTTEQENPPEDTTKKVEEVKVKGFHIE